MGGGRRRGNWNAYSNYHAKKEDVKGEFGILIDRFEVSNNNIQ
jgi:hypothetical protein